MNNSHREAVRSYLREFGCTERGRLIEEVVKRSGIERAKIQQGLSNMSNWDGDIHCSVFVGGGASRRKVYVRLKDQHLPVNHQDFGHDKPVLTLTKDQYAAYLREKETRPKEAAPWESGGLFPETHVMVCGERITVEAASRMKRELNALSWLA